jgi:TetR/AcrR family transcriptional regulator
MGIIERKGREKERRRTEILEAAEHLLFKHGLDHVTIEGVANEAEVSKATVYLYFKNKEELLFTIFNKGHHLLYELIDKDLETAAVDESKFKIFFNAMVKFQKTYPDYFDMFFYFMVNPIPVDKHNAAYIEHCEVDQVYLKKWIDEIQRGQEQGIIRRDINPIPTLLILWMQIIGLIKMVAVELPVLAERFGVTEKSLFEEYIDLTMRGLAAK